MLGDVLRNAVPLIASFTMLMAMAVFASISFRRIGN